MILVTGGAGFIGSNFILDWIAAGGGAVVNVDKLTYAGNPANLVDLAADDRYRLARGDIGDRSLVARLLAEHQPRAVLNFAAESHVDRSIHGPGEFVNTNIVGTFNLLDEVLAYWRALPASSQSTFRFLHVSTDEVYGTLGPMDPPFSERTAYAPNSPYAASKAASDHLVRAYHHTYGLPVVTTNCSNNYGPYQFPEKFIPLVILNALAEKPLPIYGDGTNVRDWLYVSDHCAAIREVLARGKVGETYNIGGNSERRNIDVVRQLCGILDDMKSRANGRPYADLITFVRDRPGHDKRYAIDCSKIAGELGWKPAQSFDAGLVKTVDWYLRNDDWAASVTSGAYKNWIEQHYADGPSRVVAEPG